VIEPASPPTEGTPSIIDPWSGRPLTEWKPGLEKGEDGNLGRPGQVWWGGNWVDPDDTRQRINESLAAEQRRAQESQQFSEQSQQLSEDWMRDRVQQLQQEAQRERQENQAREDAWNALNNIEDIADRHGYDDLWQRAHENAIRPDGSIDVDYVNRLRATLRDRLKGDQVLPNDPQPSWITRD
jgi:hypothetical protein